MRTSRSVAPEAAVVAGGLSAVVEELAARYADRVPLDRVREVVAECHRGLVADAPPTAHLVPLTKHAAWLRLEAEA